MGNYADAAAVATFAGKFNITIGEDSDYSEAEVDAFVSQFEAEVNGVLSANGYSVPAGGDTDRNMLKRFVAQRVAATLYMDTFTHDTEHPETVKLWVREWDELLKRLRLGQQHLVDQLPQGEFDPFFLVVRTPQRDDYFTRRYPRRDWDE